MSQLPALDDYDYGDDIAVDETGEKERRYLVWIFLNEEHGRVWPFL